jgi:hydroxyacylglutathione hydrolase
MIPAGKDRSSMQEFRDGSLLLIKSDPLGPFANNAYVIADAAAREAWVVDAPQEVEKLFPALEGLSVRGIVVTHRHFDHWGGIEALTAKTGAPVYCHVDDVAGRAVAGTLSDGDEIEAGGVRVRVLHTPGHTPGSICLLAGGHLIAGDTLFPGGPGRTSTPDDLRREIESITSKLYALPDSTLVHPGHGDGTTIGESRREYAVFASRPHRDDLCGDVLWAGNA